jgi:hypothetical protein
MGLSESVVDYFALQMHMSLEQLDKYYADRGIRLSITPESLVTGQITDMTNVALESGGLATINMPTGGTPIGDAPLGGKGLPSVAPIVPNVTEVLSDVEAERAAYERSVIQHEEVLKRTASPQVPEQTYQGTDPETGQTIQLPSLPPLTIIETQSDWNEYKRKLFAGADAVRDSSDQSAYWSVVMSHTFGLGPEGQKFKRQNSDVDASMRNKLRGLITEATRQVFRQSRDAHYPEGSAPLPVAPAAPSPAVPNPAAPAPAAPAPAADPAAQPGAVAPPVEGAAIIAMAPVPAGPAARAQAAIAGMPAAHKTAFRNNGAAEGVKLATLSTLHPSLSPDELQQVLVGISQPSFA